MAIFQVKKGICINIILVAHNGKQFNIPFLLTSMQRYNMQEMWGLNIQLIQQNQQKRLFKLRLLGTSFPHMVLVPCISMSLVQIWSQRTKPWMMSMEQSPYYNICHFWNIETLICSFGRMKFKVVRIVTKAACYGIKVYVITDAATLYVQ